MATMIMMIIMMMMITLTAIIVRNVGKVDESVPSTAPFRYSVKNGAESSIED